MTAEDPGPLLELEERLRFETLIADLSSEFVNLPSRDVDRKIEDAQCRVCECLGLDLSGLWQRSVEVPHTLTLTHLYRSLEGPPTPERMHASEYFPWCEQQVLAGKVIAVSSLEGLPAEAGRDRQTWLDYDIKSNLTLPLAAGGGLPIGALSFNTVRAERTWPESIVKRLQLVSQVFANAIVRKHSEQALRESEERLTMALEAAGAGAWSMDLRSRQVWVSATERDLFGFPAGNQPTYDSFLHRVHPDDRQSVRMAVENALRTKTKLLVDYRIPQPDGGVRWVAARGYPQINEKIEPGRLMGVTVDISHRKQTEAALEEARALVAAVINSTDDFVWSVDAERFGLLTWNRALRDYFLDRLHVDIRVGMPPEELLPPGYAAVWRDFYTRALREGSVVTEYEVAAHTNLLLLSIHPMQHDGKVYGISVFGKDITERKRAEEAYRIEEKRLQSVVRITRQKTDSLREFLDKALEEAIALSDSHLGYIYYYSEEQQEFTLHAWSSDVMQECSIPNPPTVYHMDKTGLWGEAVRQRRPIIVNDFAAPNPLKKGYPAGHAPLCRYMTLPVFCDGRIVAVVGVANKAAEYTDRDVQQLSLMMDSIWEVAERKRAEEAVRVLAGRLLTAQEAERSLIAREMHDDLTQRIAVLAIEAGKLEQISAASASLSGRLREIKDQLIRLSQDVHALSRQLHPSILDDLGLVDALRSECASFSQRERIPVRYTPQDVPAEIPKEVALCLYRIAQEALRNIAKHSKAREARLALTATDDSILLSVEDTGVGFNAGQTRGKPGLGLDSMEERARLIGGELTIRSKRGSGTLVEVWAPCLGKMP